MYVIIAINHVTIRLKLTSLVSYQTTKLSIIRIQVLNTGDDSVILILGTGLTSWLLPNEGECGHDHQIVHRTSFIDSVIIVMMINDSDEDHVGSVNS